MIWVIPITHIIMHIINYNQICSHVSHSSNMHLSIILQQLIVAGGAMWRSGIISLLKESKRAWEAKFLFYFSCWRVEILLAGAAHVDVEGVWCEDARRGWSRWASVIFWVLSVLDHSIGGGARVVRGQLVRRAYEESTRVKAGLHHGRRLGWTASRATTCGPRPPWCLLFII